ncbi:MAG: phenylalanine--tRNA ligase subunit alpha [Candidatus Levybacteria bacterium RIFOXYA1_FULL_41_10]|nr:MAG: Phenylalanine-tRNA ligase alpha subunit [Candidatus Levybacteria bacterium GW2011_GWA1_39_32]KKR50125.1 MAG: Phenylalanine-tRNA ligase alpha subunit [Candidatus Levybacteria bacterium GW2011_GWC1_40_19]KKR72963.1 MAG: Phenylalanine-tRNA ligase alpha subunit [Candidatus Levybacteria bacterium GW2011_GWC2_40_7]KKR94973.1 MAG: Phenylalanine-tRNA ligase alpha subunit [Candidatus Levybacteria bacterium GW2011_GWA2_41_15]OGH21104.1 MAG: phenylalanine--tRNA ligase subunit alpha [Candidatus Lev
MEEELLNIKNNAVSLILDAPDLETLEGVKLQFLGRSGKLTVAIKEITKIPQERRPAVGMLANEVKTTIENTIESQASNLKSQVSKKIREDIDVTNPGIGPPLGHLHLITQAIEEISEIFKSIGFSRVRYPEVEWDWYAFGALNFPPNHPARDDWETFFINEEPDPKYGPMVLTPHTSSGQIREMQRIKPPIRMLNLAKCYRRQSDVSHTPMFHQFEGLVVDRGISITHLKGVLDFFVKSYFGEKRQSRIRPYHFEFTEPSFEVDVTCGVCNGRARLPDGQGCRLCKEGWLEMGGAGMVHPNVLKNGGIDPNTYTGFAFGWGVERVLMMKEGIEIDDLRLLYSNKLEFLEQF